jgi:AmmeMemoRadiSam system protein A
MNTLLTPQERQVVLDLARQSVDAAAHGRVVPEPVAEGVLARRAGAFVSLHRHGDLRGCIGHIDATRTLAHVISECAAAAATGDPRFDGVRPAEVPELDIEVSVLSDIEKVTDPETIEVGRHGLIIEQHGRKGLLLPQVATEYRWDRHTFLNQTCQKAGLPFDAWMKGASIFRFEADVFGERD